MSEDWEKGQWRGQRAWIVFRKKRGRCVGLRAEFPCPVPLLSCCPATSAPRRGLQIPGAVLSVRDLA